MYILIFSFWCREPLDSCGKCETECLNTRFSLPILLRAGYSMKLIWFLRLSITDHLWKKEKRILPSINSFRVTTVIVTPAARYLISYTTLRAVFIKLSTDLEMPFSSQIILYEWKLYLKSDFRVIFAAPDCIRDVYSVALFCYINGTAEFYPESD